LRKRRKKEKKNQTYDAVAHEDLGETDLPVVLVDFQGLHDASDDFLVIGTLDLGSKHLEPVQVDINIYNQQSYLSNQIGILFQEKLERNTHSVTSLADANSLEHTRVAELGCNCQRSC